MTLQILRLKSFTATFTWELLAGDARDWSQDLLHAKHVICCWATMTPFFLRIKSTVSAPPICAVQRCEVLYPLLSTWYVVLMQAVQFIQLASCMHCENCPGLCAFPWSIVCIFNPRVLQCPTLECRKLLSGNFWIWSEGNSWILIFSGRERVVKNKIWWIWGASSFRGQWINSIAYWSPPCKLLRL